jgi:hypothetical protein
MIYIPSEINRTENERNLYECCRDSSITFCHSYVFRHVLVGTMT